METHRLHQLQEFIRRVIALNLPDALWISAETSQVKEVRGHYFIDLVEKSKEADAVLAQASAILWQKQFRAIRRERGRQVKDVLQDGLNIRLQVRVDFHERYGMRLMVEDIDPAHTLGLLESQRRADLESLQTSGAIEANGRLVLPFILQRLAIISSPTAAGYADFCDQLLQNDLGYGFRPTLFPAAMQGQTAPVEIVQQLQKIGRQADAFDAIVIVRGGGSRLDLAAFDHIDICQAIAASPLPVLTGIGHETDDSLVDSVAHTALKTPTALANFILDRHLQFESQLLAQGRQVGELVRQRVQQEQLRLQHTHQRIHLLAKNKVLQQHVQLRRLQDEIYQQAKQNLRFAQLKLDQWETRLQALHPRQILAQGYVWIEKDGQQLKEKLRLEKGDVIRLHFRDGQVDAVVE